MKDLLDLTLDEFKSELISQGESGFRAKQVFDWIYKGVFDYNDMKNIPQALKDKLKDGFKVGIPKVVEEYTSNDGTKKLLVSLEDGNLIECVIMKYIHGNTICISTQVGCRMGCKFCASTLGGVIRNITSGEMIGQILLAQNILGERISNVVLMGSGEPLDNFDNVMKFLELVNAEYGLNIGQRHITLSTCGIVPKIYELADKDLSITLAISLHAFSDEKRREIMPIANKYSIKEIMDACAYYIDKTNRRITFEYSLVKGVNDSKEDAKALASLLRGVLCHVNLIPVNEIKEKEYRKSSKEDIKAFEAILKSHGIEATVRREMGSDINAACGQLRRSYLETRNSN
ncbi:23S rRNA (adenine(2503)-C(2))-methyltransferase RlmN [Clostridium paridis]|uniref:Probable dual-specificity RNA methyltransferase RlmN n=1 Tax=Clostridium paridis TaxID=2803863 RepID=A0A937FEI3_9CLOT|nr:23S rRNA (adenine(2503)-C(2))-methyltransferase RlmN [Clostridium paridis]MBL4930827.1 23S rRNA (adenine(2503)-C(2))-methyltransferase RlmN [Clostridium paridis]